MNGSCTPSLPLLLALPLPMICVCCPGTGFLCIPARPQTLVLLQPRALNRGKHSTGQLSRLPSQPGSSLLLGRGSTWAGEMNHLTTTEDQNEERLWKLASVKQCLRQQEK